MFKPANEALDASLKDLTRYGLISSINLKRPISKEDLEALYAAKQLGLETPESLVDSATIPDKTTWEFLSLHVQYRTQQHYRRIPVISPPDYKPTSLLIEISSRL